MSSGALPQTLLGELTALPQAPLARFEGPTSKGGEGGKRGGDEREEKGGEGREGGGGEGGRWPFW